MLFKQVHKDGIIRTVSSGGRAVGRHLNRDDLKHLFTYDGICEVAAKLEKRGRRVPANCAALLEHPCVVGLTRHDGIYDEIPKVAFKKRKASSLFNGAANHDTQVSAADESSTLSAPSNDEASSSGAETDGGSENSMKLDESEGRSAEDPFAWARLFDDLTFDESVSEASINDPSMTAEKKSNEREEKTGAPADDGPSAANVSEGSKSTDSSDESESSEEEVSQTTAL